MTVKTALALAALALALAGCAEKTQTAQTRKSDSKPWDGSTTAEFTASGWKAGDQASWEEQMRTRAQAQNEYSRAAAP
jgi:ABC-type glycerol-3-phosphate transport system substrate-binding protein